MLTERKDGMEIVVGEFGAHAIDRDGNVLPCSYYNGKWHVSRFAMDVARASSIAAQIEAHMEADDWKRPRFSYRPRHRPDPDEVRMIAAGLGADVPREELPDELDVQMCAGFSGLDPRHVRKLASTGTWKGAYKEGRFGGWRIPRDAYLRWLVERGQRSVFP